MSAAAPSARSGAWQNFHRIWPWLAYAVGWLLLSTGCSEAGSLVFLLGMLRHWKFWLLVIGSFAIGFWWGSRRHRRACRA